MKDPPFGVHVTYADGTAFDTSSMVDVVAGAVSGAGATVSNELTNSSADEVQLFEKIIGDALGTAELLRIEDPLAMPYTSQGLLTDALSSSGSAGGLIFSDVGSSALTPSQDTPIMLTFEDAEFGNKAAAGFNPTPDSIQLSQKLAQSFADLQNHMTSVGGGTLFSFDSTHSVQISGIAP
jgi:hypothetical protein